MGTENEKEGAGGPMVCLPGQRLCLADGRHLPGQGTYERQGYLYSCLAGVAELVRREGDGGPVTVEVRAVGRRTIVPSQGDVVTARVQQITQQLCRCQIVAVREEALARPYRGLLRREDVRAQEKDRVEMYRSFRPGDIILAKVLPITEAHTFQLTTAENELGVVIAHSQNGHPMVPISWTEMQCSKTFVKEPRKVAKVPPENVT